MIRWNGWGDAKTNMPVPKEGLVLLEELVGKTARPQDVGLEESQAKVGESRLPDHELVSKEPQHRLDKAHGQSFPDWVAMRTGTLSRFPDAVAFPQSTEQCEEVLEYAEKNQALVIPFGGGTSVVGHLTVPDSHQPVLSLSMERMNRLVSLDSYSSLAVFEAGVPGPHLEAQLAAHGLTLGHYPQSFELSTLGGWVVTRSSGQQSMHFGRIEQLFQGGEMLTPRGRLDLPPLPASAAGPDLRQLVLGSEGRMGLLTRATVKVTPQPDNDDFYGLFFPSWQAGAEAAREMAVARLPLSMIRLSNPKETMTNMALSGHVKQTGMLKKYLSLRGIREDNLCMMLLGVLGSNKTVAAGKSQAMAIARKHKGVVIGQAMGRAWEKKRFLIPYVRNGLWEGGYMVDTLETATTWDKATRTMEQVEEAIRNALAEQGEKVHVFTHLSHVYPTGSSCYTSFVFRPGASPQETIARWKKIKTAASLAINKAGGTISHQHGVGADHAPFLEAEKGPLGMDILKNTFGHLDPENRMNPGKLVA